MTIDETKDYIRGKGTMKIVTNGKRFRILRPNGSFYEKLNLSPEGGSYTSVFETRFYLRALRHWAGLMRAQVANRSKEKWEAV